MNDHTSHIESLEHLMADACPRRAHTPRLPSYLLSWCLGVCVMVGVAVVLA